MTTSTHVGTATGSGGADNDGGVIAGAGNVGSSRWTSKSSLDLVRGAEDYGSKLGVSTGTKYVVGLAVARSLNSPKFGFTPKRADRSATNSTFMINGASTKIANITSSESILGLLGSNHSVRSLHLHTDDHYQRGSWATLAFNLFRNPTAASTSNHGLVQSDLTDKSGATNYGTAAIFRNIADQDNARPVTNVPSRAIPGELVFLVDFVTRTTSGGNFKDYSAITGG